MERGANNCDFFVCFYFDENDFPRVGIRIMLHEVGLA